MEEGKDLGRRPELVGGGLIRSLGGWSKVISLRQGGEKQEYDSRVLGSGEFVQALLREADVGMAKQIRPKIREFLVKKEMKDFYTQAGVRWGNFAGGVKGEWWPM
jgi:hypothetical protein